MTQALDKVEEIMEALEADLGVYDDLVIAKAKAEAKYRSLRAKEYFKAKADPTLKTVAERDAFVDSELENEFYDFRLSDAKLDAHKNRLQAMRSLLSAAQTLASAGRI